MLEIKTISMKSDDFESIVKEVRDKKAHYVAWACEGLTFAAEFCKAGLQTDTGRYRDLFNDINYKKETGTLYPQAFMTFMPIGNFTLEQTLAHLKDVFVANRMMGTNKIYIDLQDKECGYCEYIPFSVDQYREMCMDVINSSHLGDIDEIIFISPKPQLKK